MILRIYLLGERVGKASEGESEKEIEITRKTRVRSSWEDLGVE